MLKYKTKHTSKNIYVYAYRTWRECHFIFTPVDRAPHKKKYISFTCKLVSYTREMLLNKHKI